jgi:hypothetical protein
MHADRRRQRELVIPGSLSNETNRQYNLLIIIEPFAKVFTPRIFSLRSLRLCGEFCLFFTAVLHGPMTHP